METNKTQPISKTQGLTRAAIVTALYVAITLVIAPFAFGPVQFRLSEIFNYLALYNRRYVWAVTLGVAIANFIGSTPIDMVVGSLQTLVFLTVGRILTKKLEGKRMAGGILKTQHLVFNILFSASMIVIAAMLHFMYDMPLMFTWLTVAAGEFVVLFIGGFVIDILSQSTDLTK
jgi:uncharacterized membrane protein